METRTENVIKNVIKENASSINSEHSPDNASQIKSETKNKKKGKSKKRRKFMKSMLADNVLQYNIEFILPHDSRNGIYWSVKVFVVRSRRANYWDIYTNPLLRSTMPVHDEFHSTRTIFGKELGTPAASIDTSVLKTEFKADTKISGYLSERLFSIIFPDNADDLLKEIHGLGLSIKMKLVAERANFKCPERICGTIVSCVNRAGKVNFEFSILREGWVLVNEAGNKINKHGKGFSDSMVLLEMENASTVSVINRPSHSSIFKKSKVVMYE